MKQKNKNNLQIMKHLVNYYNNRVIRKKQQIKAYNRFNLINKKIFNIIKM